MIRTLHELKYIVLCYGIIIILIKNQSMVFHTNKTFIVAYYRHKIMVIPTI